MEGISIKLYQTVCLVLYNLWFGGHYHVWFALLWIIEIIRHLSVCRLINCLLHVTVLRCCIRRLWRLYLRLTVKHDDVIGILSSVENFNTSFSKKTHGQLHYCYIYSNNRVTPIILLFHSDLNHTIFYRGLSVSKIQSKSTLLKLNSITVYLTSPIKTYFKIFQ